MAARIVVFHYHLFKNAGTSVDRILKDNFTDKWLTHEFSMASQNNTAEIEKWISSTPDGVAYSTHTAMGPLPTLSDVNLVPIILLRDPIDRIISAYNFERRQQADTFGTRLARENNLEGYVRARLASGNDRQCRNFYTHRLASLAPAEGPELERAKKGLSLLYLAGVVGRVERFDAFLAQLADRIRPRFPDFTWRSTRENISDGMVREKVSQELLGLLRLSNRDDYTLLARLEELDGTRH